MMMIVSALVLIAAMKTHQLAAEETRRVYRGIDDTERKYPYVVALVNNYRRCTGTLISPNWVVTAAHCLSSSTHIQYGNMKIQFSESDSKRKILHIEQPPAPHIMVPDLGLLYINTVPMKEYGQVSAVDYKTMEGHAVEYTGFGFTQKDLTKDIEKVFKHDQVRPLQLGEAIVSTCEKKEFAFAPYLCVAPKCSNKEQQTLPGDSGGPLFHDGKLAAVLIGGHTLNSIRFYTPLSPYLSWIHEVITRPPNFKSIGTAVVDTANIPVQHIKVQNISRYLYGLKVKLKTYREQVLSALFQEINRTKPNRTEP